VHDLFSEKTTLAPNAKQTGSPAHGAQGGAGDKGGISLGSELVVDLHFDSEEMRTPWLSQYVLRPEHNLATANE